MFIEKIKYKKIVIFPLLILGLLILIFYNQKEEEILIENNHSNEIAQNNYIENVNYNYEDPSGNLYTVRADKGEFDMENAQIIFMTDVSANLLMNNGISLKIISDYGKYNISNNDTIFSKNIIIEYIDNKIYANYLDFSLSRNNLIISKDVVLENKNNNLEADIIEIDIISKMIKVLMHNQNEKVKINITN
jgi:hypothetical protein